MYILIRDIKHEIYMFKILFRIKILYCIRKTSDIRLRYQVDLWNQERIKRRQSIYSKAAIILLSGFNKSLNAETILGREDAYSSSKDRWSGTAAE